MTKKTPKNAEKPEELAEKQRRAAEERETRRAAKEAEREERKRAYREKHDKELQERAHAAKAERREEAALRRETMKKVETTLLPPLPPFVEKLSECSDDLLLAILERVSSGELFSRVCHEHGIQKHKVTAYINRVPEFKILWETARRAQSESWSDDIIELADGASIEDAGVVQIQINVRKWIMGKNNIRFSEKSTVTLEGGDKPIKHEATIKPGMSEAEAAAAYAATRRKMQGEEE